MFGAPKGLFRSIWKTRVWIVFFGNLCCSSCPQCNKEVCDTRHENTVTVENGGFWGGSPSSIQRPAEVWYDWNPKTYQQNTKPEEVFAWMARVHKDEYRVFTCIYPLSSHILGKPQPLSIITIDPKFLATHHFNPPTQLTSSVSQPRLYLTSWVWYFFTPRCHFL